MYEPKHLRLWTMPANYAGEVWPDYYSSGVGQSRDSDTLERSNFTAMLADLGGESETVIVVRESHWAVGWVEWIAIHSSDDRALETADENVARLADYPVLDEDGWSELEYNEASDYWDAQSPRSKVRYAMDVRSSYHWLQNEPVWIYGRMTYGDICRRDDTISQAIMESLRE